MKACPFTSSTSFSLPFSKVAPWILIQKPSKSYIKLQKKYSFVASTIFSIRAFCHALLVPALLTSFPLICSFFHKRTTTTPIVTKLVCARLLFGAKSAYLHCRPFIANKTNQDSQKFFYSWDKCLMISAYFVTRDQSVYHGISRTEIRDYSKESGNAGSSACNAYRCLFEATPVLSGIESAASHKIFS